jgi:hypothetical protein
LDISEVGSLKDYNKGFKGGMPSFALIGVNTSKTSGSFLLSVFWIYCLLLFYAWKRDSLRLEGVNSFSFSADTNDKYLLSVFLECIYWLWLLRRESSFLFLH